MAATPTMRMETLGRLGLVLLCGAGSAAHALLEDPLTQQNMALANNYTVNSTAAPAHTATFTFPTHFAPEQSMSIAIPRGQVLWMPLDPVRSQLMDTAQTSNDAIALELSTCSGKMHLSVAKTTNHNITVSSAAYQCLTFARSPGPSLSLCPLYDPQNPPAMHVAPVDIRGFILHADIRADVDVIVTLRTTKTTQDQAFAMAFAVPEEDPDDDDEVRSDFNMTYQGETTSMTFKSLSVVDLRGNLNQTRPCSDCKFHLHARLLTSENDATVGVVEAPTQCLVRDATVKVAIHPEQIKASLRHAAPWDPWATTLDVKTTTRLMNAVVGGALADQFVEDGLYQFTLVASLPPSVNNQHKRVYYGFSSQQKHYVTAPDHFLLAFLLVGVIAGGAVYITKQRQARDHANATQAIALEEAVGLLTRHDYDHHDGEAKGTATHDVDASTTMPPREEDEEPAREADQLQAASDNLLNAIKASKEKTPQSALETRDGYHEIN